MHLSTAAPVIGRTAVSGSPGRRGRPLDGLLRLGVLVGASGTAGYPLRGAARGARTVRLGAG
ncbi:MAG: hypothetical protein ACYCXY_13625, partial [Acidimicrobiales bacterium]